MPPTDTHIPLGILCAFVLLVVVACGGESEPLEEVRSSLPGIGRTSVQGTVTFRERLELTSGARLIVELRDVSYADADAILVTSQTITNPGPVPIRFKIDYNRADIDPRNVYSIGARIIEHDGRLAFINDTAHDVITRGNPNRVNMVLKLVQPPPDQVGDRHEDWRKWVETPAQITGANLLPNEPEPYIRINFYQSTIEGCARRGNEKISVDGADIIARVTLMQPPDTPWAIPCNEEVVQLDTVLQVPTKLTAGERYRVIVNGREMSTLSLPPPDLGFMRIAESPIETVALTTPESGPGGYELRVVSGLPRGGSCSHFNGYELRRPGENQIDVTITHHEVSDPEIVCTTDYPVVETTVPLGDDFKEDVEYTVSVNGITVDEFPGQ